MHNYPPQTKANLTISQEFIDYWNKWHKEWYIKASTWTPLSNLSLEKVLEWKVPSFIGDGKQTPSWQFLPEPYWGNPNGELEAIFLNINPGKGDTGQHISTIKAISEPAHAIQDYKNSYSHFLDRLSGYSNSTKENTDYYRDSFEWWNNKVEWASKVLNTPITINQVLGAELAPWHTKRTSKELSRYIREHLHPLKDNILEPLLKMSKGIMNDIFKDSIICRGADTAHAMEIIYKNCERKTFILQHENQAYFRANTYMVDYTLIIVFVAENKQRGMALPDKVNIQIENHTTSSLRDLIVTIKKKWGIKIAETVR